jgi:hypothetical protein
MKNIVIFYTPGAYGSFLTWLIDRFNLERKSHQPKITDNPLQPDGSSHGHVSLCKRTTVNAIEQWINDVDVTPWGYRIWGGWPVNTQTTLDQAIDQTLKVLGNQDHLIVVSRTTERETELCWLNAQSKLDPERLRTTFDIDSNSNIDIIYQRELEQRHFKRRVDARLIEISVNEILSAPADRLLSFVDQLGLVGCDQDLLESVLPQHRALQTNIKKIHG